MHRHILSDEFLSLEGVMEFEHVEVWGAVWCGVHAAESVGPAVDRGLLCLAGSTGL